MKKSYAQFLKSKNLSENSCRSYLWTVEFYKSHYRLFTEKKLAEYRAFLQAHYKPETVNLRIIAINKYLKYIGKEKLALPFIKTQQKKFLENVISNADYEFLKESLRKHEDEKWYFIVWYLAATGMRISELVQLKIEHVCAGYVDMYSKGNKLRRIYIPKTLHEESIAWLKAHGRKSGYLFLNRQGNALTPRGIAAQLHIFAKKYGINEKVVHPHSFRHRFAKNFLEKYNDIALLADLLGHESIETTRIYLRRSATEQQVLVDNVVTW